MGEPVKFDFEWIEAPGVRDQVLAATWARLSLMVERLPVFEAIDARSESRRTSVYGSLFPLAQWFVENWWHLHHEPAHRHPMPGGRVARPDEMRWVRRHNLLAAREGGAYPDLNISRDGSRLLLSWQPDPVASQPTRLRFVGKGSSWVEVGEFEREVSALICSVLARLEEKTPGNGEVEQLAEAWAAICSADSHEKTLCRALAVLGADPYDPAEATEDLIKDVERSFGCLPEELHDDLLESTTRLQCFKANLAWVEREASGVRPLIQGYSFPTIDPVSASAPHEAGYLTARLVRSDLLRISNDEPIKDLAELIVDRLGWSTDCFRLGTGQASFDGMVGLDAETAAPLLISAGPGRMETSRLLKEAQRFLLARATFFPVTRNLGSRARLISGATTPQQRTARAYAAELLAPARALEKRVSGEVGQEQLADLAAEFQVSTWLIGHQIDNHRLGYVAA